MHHLIELSSTPPPAGHAAGAAAAGATSATVKKIQRGGMFLGALIVTIVFLMVVKPRPLGIQWRSK